MLPFKSCLFTPATHPERFSKAAEIGATLLIIDLEDSIALQDKNVARQNAINYLQTQEFRQISIAVRVNDINSRQGVEDVLALINTKLHYDFLLLPKFNSQDSCYWLNSLLTEAQMDLGIMGLIETANGVEILSKLQNSLPRLQALMLGAADLSADLGCDIDSSMLEQVHNQLLQTCAKTGITAIDSPYFSITDEAGLLNECQQAHRDGFYCKAAIHPRQIPIINSVFTPTEQEIAYAKQVLEENKKGVGVIDGKMIDEAIAKKARRTLSLVNEK